MYSMDEIRDEVLRNKTLKDMSLNSEVTDFRCKVDYRFKWSGKVNSIYSSRYTNMYGDWKLDKETALKYINNSHEISKFIKQKHANEDRINAMQNYKDISFCVYLEPTMYYELTYIDGDKIWASENITIDENHYAPLLNYITESNTQVYSEVTDENIHIQFGDYETTLSPDEEPNDISNFSEFMLEYLSSSEEWVNAEIGLISEIDDGTINIPISINSESVSLEFINPQDKNSEIWDLVKEFGSNDPWDLQNEIALISFTAPEYIPTYEYDLYHIRNPNKQTKTGEKIDVIKSKIVSILT